MAGAGRQQTVPDGVWPAGLTGFAAGGAPPAAVVSIVSAFYFLTRCGWDDDFPIGEDTSRAIGDLSARAHHHAGRVALHAAINQQLRGWAHSFTISCSQLV